MNYKQIMGIVDRIRQDSSLNQGDKILACLNRGCDSMLEGAYLITASGVQDVYWETSSDGIQADEAVIRMSKDRTNLVSFHESRPSSRDHRPNGIRVHREELDFPCVVFCNGGVERVTVDGEWLAPGEYVSIQEADLNDPEVQKFLDEYIRSPEVTAGVEEARRAYAEKIKGKEGM